MGKVNPSDYKRGIYDELPECPQPTWMESDPNGIPVNTPGAKLDAGKQLPFLVLSEFSLALKQVVKVGTFGANKYTPRGWLQVPDGENRYREAAMRHWLESIREEVDADSSCMHEAQQIWNLLAALELKMRSRTPA